MICIGLLAFMGITAVQKSLKLNISIPSNPTFLVKVGYNLDGSNNYIDVFCNSELGGGVAVGTGFGLSENLIGLTIVACGTSLPELVTSVVAAKKNEVDMALGNVIGSNVFNVLFVLGIATSISPIAFIMENIIDIAILTLMSAFVWILGWTKQKIDRKEGIIMLVMYAVYLVYICVR